MDNSNWIFRVKNQDSKNGDYSNVSMVICDHIAIAKDEEYKDTLDIKFILLHEGANLNHDGFYDEELAKSYTTIINKPINWEHSKENIGVVTKSHYLNPNDESYANAISELDIEDLAKNEKSKFIVCEGVIWKRKHPERTLEILNAYSSNQLYFSMENHFKEAECSICNSRFQSLPYCGHLLDRHKNGKAVRYFRDIIFTGVGKVEHPGDPGARGLSFAKKIDTEPFLFIIDSNELFTESKDREEFAFYVENNYYDQEECPCNSIEDLPQDSNAEKLLWLFVCKDKNEDLFNKAISELKGEQTMPDYKTKEEFDNALEVAKASFIEKFKKDNDITNQISTLTTEKETAIAEVEKVKAENLTLSGGFASEKQKLVEEYEIKVKKLTEDYEKATAEVAAIKSDNEKNEKFQARYEKIATAGVTIDKEKVKILIWDMSDASFDNFFGIVTTNKVKAKVDEKEKEELAIASLETKEETKVEKEAEAALEPIKEMEILLKQMFTSKIV